MVVTRSQGDAAEEEEQRRERERREIDRIETERQRRLSQNPPESPTMAGESSTTAPVATIEQPTTKMRTDRPPSPQLSVRSHQSNTSITTRMRQAELEAAEKIAAIQKRQFDIEAELVQKQLAVQLSSLQDEMEEPVTIAGHNEKVDEWLRTNTSRGAVQGAKNERTNEEFCRPVTPHAEERERTKNERPNEDFRRTNENYRHLRFDTRERSPTPNRDVKMNSIVALADSIEKMARPRLRQVELPTFNGSPNEWLPFNAAFKDSTRMYDISAAENLQRLRSCLRGEARDTVAALLHTATNPEVIMSTLQRCYGRPEVIIDRAIEDLRKLPKPGVSATELNSFAVKIQNVVCVLKSIDRRGYLYNPMLAREILEKLSPHIRSRWCDYAIEQSDEDPEIVLLSRFLIREADRALRYTYSPTTSASSAAAAKKENKPAATKKKTNSVYAIDEKTEDQAEQCPSCSEAHALHRCPTYLARTVEQRWELVKENKLCFKCVHKKHRRLNCKARLCGVNNCRRPHHATLHQERSSDQPRESNLRTSPSDTEATVSSVTATGSRAVLLKVCPVTVAGPRGEVNTYALLDEGSTITLIDEELAKKIGAEGPSQPLNLHGVNTSQREGNSKLVSIRLKGRKDSATYKLRARTVKNLQLHQQSIPETLLKYEHLKDLLEEDVCYEFARPSILVGTDYWECIVSRELRVGGRNQPAASRTQLGWVLHGTAPRSVIYSQDSVLHIYEQGKKEQCDYDLHKLVEEHFRIEALGVARKERVSNEDRRAISIAERTIKKRTNEYEIGLPWRSDNTRTPPSYEMALRRLVNIEKKMKTNENFSKEYAAQMKNLFEKGYAVPCDGSERDSAVSWYLPHFTVQNINKPGKYRLVFDAAAKSYGVSLNDLLLEGPDLLLSLQGILFRFREKPIAVSADIQEMFLRMKIRDEDQPAQQFLWRDGDSTRAPTRYKMKSVIFGAASSPFMAHFVRDYNAHVHAESHPRAFIAITRAHYVDDLVTSFDDEEQARRTISELQQVHAAAGFQLRKWSSSSKDVLHGVPTELHATTPSQLGDTSPENKILGLVWDAEQDELGFNTSMNRVPTEVRKQVRAPTKREALSAVMSIYDPLGLLSQFTIRAKIVLQSLWRLQTTWDEPIPEEENHLFASWLLRLYDVARLRLRRCYDLRDSVRVELHVMCDASEQAYAAVAYWRIQRNDGVYTTTLVAAKAKVAPRRVQTIPLLELQAAVIGARLADTIRREHDVEVTRTCYWTDSTTVVHWIRNDKKRYTPFVAHRLSEIEELTHRSEWRWLPTDMNIADDATRPALRDEGLTHRMEWRFIPPGAPNQGGAWERMVRSVKTALNVTLKEKAPPEEVLQTLMTEAEFSVNARPLTHVSVNADDPEALTPNHFLLGSSTGLPSTGPCEEADRRTWRATQALADHFWRRWVKEYLPTLVARGEPSHAGRTLREGDIVLVVDHTLPRNTWPMGRVVRTYQGSDGGIRVADVSTKTGVFKRPATRLVVLQTKEEATRATPGGEC